MVTPFTLLALAVASLWLAGADPANRLRRNLWLVLFVASLVAAVAAGVVQPVGLVAVAAVAGAAFGFSRTSAGRGQKIAAGLALLALAVGLMLHRLPGFNNPRVIDAVRFTADAIPFSLYLNYDKVLVGLFVLGWCHMRISRGAEWRAMLAAAAPRAAVVALVVMALSLAGRKPRVHLHGGGGDLPWLHPGATGARLVAPGRRSVVGFGGGRGVVRPRARRGRAGLRGSRDRCRGRVRLDLSEDLADRGEHAHALRPEHGAFPRLYLSSSAAMSGVVPLPRGWVRGRRSPRDHIAQ